MRLLSLNMTQATILLISIKKLLPILVTHLLANLGNTLGYVPRLLLHTWGFFDIVGTTTPQRDNFRQTDARLRTYIASRRNNDKSVPLDKSGSTHHLAVGEVHRTSHQWCVFESFITKDGDGVMLQVIYLSVWYCRSPLRIGRKVRTQNCLGRLSWLLAALDMSLT